MIVRACGGNVSIDFTSEFGQDSISLNLFYEDAVKLRDSLSDLVEVMAIKNCKWCDGYGWYYPTGDDTPEKIKCDHSF